jgi:hypothetical protein
MSLHLRPSLIVLALALGGAAGGAFADTAKTAQIYLQRDATGRSVLTDRPSASAVTERTWAMDREDPVAAQQRALDVRREAEAVSVRVQRSIEAQLARSSEEGLMRQRLAMLERQNGATSMDGDDDTTTVFAPIGFGANRFDHRRQHHRSGHSPSRPGPFRGSGSPGSR